MCHLCRLYRLFHCRAEKYLGWWDWRELTDIDHGNTSLSSDSRAGPIGLGGAGSCQVVEVTVLGGIINSHIIDSSRTPCEGIMYYFLHHYGLNYLPWCGGILSSTFIVVISIVIEGVGTLVSIAVPVATVGVGQIVEVAVSAGGAPS